MTSFEIITLVVTLMIALGGWLFAWWQAQDNRRFRREDTIREQRQQKADRVLAYLEEAADLAYVYRILANYSNRLVTDDSGQSTVVEKALYPTERFDNALKLIEGKDTRAVAAIQALRLHRRQGEIGDLLTDLDPSGETRKELGLLYIATVHNLERAVEDRDWQSFFTMLEEIDAQRAALRARVQALVESEKDKRSHGRQAGKEAG